jgi:hypothetical protein
LLTTKYGVRFPMIAMATLSQLLRTLMFRSIQAPICR